MDIDKWRSGKREIENFDSFYRKFEGAEPGFTQFATIPPGATMRMRYIDLIDWTSTKNQLVLIMRNPTYSFFAFLVFKFRWMRFQAAIRKFDHQLTSNRL